MLSLNLLITLLLAAPISAFASPQETDDETVVPKTLEEECPDLTEADAKGDRVCTIEFFPSYDADPTVETNLIWYFNVNDPDMQLKARKETSRYANGQKKTEISDFFQ